jgi:hypothetical protein
LFKRLLFWKKEAKNFLSSRALAWPSSMQKIHKNLFASFSSEKEVLFCRCIMAIKAWLGAFHDLP